jgi:hypothetical protein
MAYKNDIFISYRRDPETLEWINKHLVPLLSLRLNFELGRAPSIFIDTQLETGVSWKNQLGNELAQSRILFILWSGNYLNSQWCTLEMSLMLERERKTKRRTAQNPRGLVIPAFIHDGSEFPYKASDIQYFEIQKTFNVRMAKDSVLAEELDSILTTQAPAIAKAIVEAPPWRKEWVQLSGTQLYKKLFKGKTSQDTLPRFSSR